MPTDTINRWKSQVNLRGPSINKASSEQMNEIDPELMKSFKEDNQPKKDEEEAPKDSSFVIVRNGKKYYFNARSGTAAAKSLALPKSEASVIDSTLDAYSIKPKK
jgi:hypothetical protein